MGYSNWDDDKADLDAVIAHFERQGYYIYALIGHSRGMAYPLFFCTGVLFFCRNYDKLHPQPISNVHLLLFSFVYLRFRGHLLPELCRDLTPRPHDSLYCQHQFPL